MLTASPPQLGPRLHGDTSRRARLGTRSACSAAVLGRARNHRCGTGGGYCPSPPAGRTSGRSRSTSWLHPRFRCPANEIGEGLEPDLAVGAEVLGCHCQPCRLAECRGCPRTETDPPGSLVGVEPALPRPSVELLVGGAR